ncbi:MAG: hypothetical protein F8N37_11335 [Telmatospirillum sp.]|nr:hypothetical protein [Telmatospirillum sp.]
MVGTVRSRSITAMAALSALTVSSFHGVQAEENNSYLAALHRHVTLTSTIPENGDLNPYAVFVAPVSAGKIQKDDVIVDNFNNISNLQGTGGTIVLYTPSTKKTSLFASLPQNLKQCPGGVGLSTAMVMLKSGWVIVGSAPSTDGTMKTRGDGCLLVLDANGQLVSAWSGPNINYPWGNMAVIDSGDKATLFISMAGFDVPGPDVLDPKTGRPVVVNKATVLRMNLQISAGKPPVVTDETVIGDGFGQAADKDVFLVGPTGVVLGPDDTLYVSDALGNRIVAIDQASTRTASAGTGRDISKDGKLRRPLALAMAPNGNLIALNAKNGQAVEIDPNSGKQLAAQWIDANPAQSPPGNGDLFGLAMKPDGSGFYYVEDDVNTLVEAVP